MGVTYIVGAGGIGCAVGYGLLKAGHKVVFVDVDAGKIEFGNRNGVKLNDGEFRIAKFIHSDDWNPTEADKLYLTTKCYDNASVLAKTPVQTEIVPIQNGYDSILESRSHAVECIASFVARCEPGRTCCRITRRGWLHIGFRHSTWAIVEDDLDCIHETLDYTKETDIRPIKATKLMYNAAISPIAAAAGLDNGELLSLPKAQKLFFDLIEENYRILTSANVPLGKVGPFHPRTVSRILRQRWLAKLMARSFEKSLRGTYCSMAGEIEKGRTELDNYTGHLLRLAGDTIPAPINRRVYDVVSRMTRERTPPHRGVIDELTR